MTDKGGCVCTDHCRFLAGRPEEAPADCPTRLDPETVARCREIYRTPGTPARQIWQAFAKLIGTGGAKKSRVEHVVDFCLAMGLKRIGLASCLRYLEETWFLHGVLADQGLAAHVAFCKIGGFQTRDIDIDKETDWIICNPLAQALVLNKLGCELNVTLGLCMGQELIFNRYSEGYVTNLIVKEKISRERPRDTMTAMIDGQYQLSFWKP